ncbi:hypothetical protein BDW59DRAFT_145879 [Aspergillus cavernicola]|uniref:DUF7730 domain-containing protein n=1 Tax=Aspergillus cavernicola TaxID=176166 RepID=A0ABR4IFQ8_9EURO
MVATNFLSRLFQRAPRHRSVNARQQPPEPAVSSIPQGQVTPNGPISINNTPYWSRALFDSPGISETTCRVDGSPDDPGKLPILPPNHRCLFSKISESTSPESDTQSRNQIQSRFFTHLPPEIRQIIYLHAFGGRRIHLDHNFFPYDRQNQWRWWHRVCDDAPNCPEKEFICPDTADAELSMLQLGSSAWVKKGFEYKIDAVAWLRCCRIGYQESLPVLYGSNTFVLSQGVDQLFRISRVLPSAHLDLLTSMAIEIDVYRICKGRPPGMDSQFREFYGEFFSIIEQRLPGLRGLSLSIAGIPRAGGWDIEWSDEQQEMWIGPWESLARSRYWKRLEIAVPASWFDEFESVVLRRGQENGGLGYGLMKGLPLFRKGW